MSFQVVFTICLFGAVAMIAYFGSSLMLSKDEQQKKVRNRLTGGIEAGQKRTRLALLPLLQQLGQAAARPFLPKTAQRQSSMRRKLALAGIYSSSSLKMMTGCKVILLCTGLFLGYLAGNLIDQPFVGLPVGALMGYLLPVIWLKIRIKKNHEAIDRALPDTLDLLVVCVEAGLTVDSSLQRIGQELALAHPALSREFNITHMETRVGLARGEALRNLGERTGVAGLQSLAAMLIQAERFGTSIASALRIHAEAVRDARRFAAEERAAKTSVKLTFPLVLFIFPSTFIILAGPTIIDLMNSPLFQ